MKLIPVTLPPGVFRNGTRYQAKGRWHSANRVRWHDGSMCPVGGWQEKLEADGTTTVPPIVGEGEFVRDGYAWRDNTKSQFLVWGTNNGVIWQKESGDLEDISPLGLAPGPAEPSIPSGYGVGLYGTGAYGVDRVSPDQIPDEVGRWDFDTWGENLICFADWDGVLYEWEPVTGQNLTPLLNAPVGIDDFIITQERMIMTIGAPDELRKVQWCDQENNTVWNDAITNQAGSYVLPGDGKLLGIYRLRNQNFILSETDAWVVRYLGPPYVYGFEKVADFCAPMHRKTATVLPTGELLWAGKRNFWIFDGQVKPLPCDLIDFLLHDISLPNISKTFFWVNAAYREIWMHYASVRDEPITPPAPGAPASIEPGQYVYWKWDDNHWSQGSMERTAAVAPGVYNDPQMVDFTGRSFWHERAGLAYDDMLCPCARTGPIELGLGETNTAISGVYLDAQTGNWISTSDDGLGRIVPAAASFFFESRQMPMGPAIKSAIYTYDPENRDQPVPTRVLGRDHMLAVFSDPGVANTWEWGDFRLAVTNIGTGSR